MFSLIDIFGNDGLSQSDRILAIFRRNKAKGRRTKRSELMNIGIANVTARITDLRNKGHKIVMYIDREEKTTNNRYKLRHTSYDIE